MNKKLFILLLIALLLSGTSVAYAYWDKLEQSTTETVLIGEGVSLEMVANVTTPDGIYLVPQGTLLGVNDVNEVVLEYSIKLNKEAQEDVGLNVSVTNILIGDSNEFSDLVNIEVYQTSQIVTASEVIVTLTVSIENPETYEDYLQIFNQAITFTVTFTGSAI